jgi:hypothetical protein
MGSTNNAGCDKGLSLGTDPSSRAQSVLQVSIIKGKKSSYLLEVHISNRINSIKFPSELQNGC